jgi:hypothetical protein
MCKENAAPKAKFQWRPGAPTLARLKSMEAAPGLPARRCCKPSRLAIRETKTVRRCSKGAQRPDDADEGYTVIRDALKQTRKVAVGQLIMHGRGHLVGIKAHGKGLMLSILRYGNEVRATEPYFDRLTAKPNTASLRSRHQSVGRELHCA